MQPDPEYLRQHYASLSDEALLEIDRGDLVETAQKLYDAEFARRDLASVPGELREDSDGEEPEAYEPTPQGDRPDWLDDASVVIAYNASRGNAEPPGAADAFDALRSAGIPCYLDLVKVPEELSPSQPKYEWRVMVPVKFNFRATSVLNKDIFNADFEDSWKAHLETLSDKDLAQMTPRETFCGVFDLIERVTKVYNEELARRRGLSTIE
jgi:hypothetical protein